MIDDIELIYFDLIKLITEMITPSIFNYFILQMDMTVSLTVFVILHGFYKWLMMILQARNIKMTQIFSVIDFRFSTV